MAVSLGRVVATLAEPLESIPTELIELINQRIDPPEKVHADDVYVRAMYVVSDEVNSFGGCFPLDEHPRLAELLVDSPVMIGHRKDKLPIGRTFHSAMTERDGRPWVKSYFYWLRSDARAEQLRDNIDGGVYKECSVAFTFMFPECSLCGHDIRTCEHQPLQDYTVNGLEQHCHFNYRRLEKVLETSLVYRGAVPHTRITKELGVSDDTTPLADIDTLPLSRRYLLTPRYDGLPVTAFTEGGSVVVAGPGGCAVPTDGYLATWRPEEPVSGVLVGYRGKDRCSRADLMRYLKDHDGPVTRLLLNVYPDGATHIPRCAKRSSFDVRMIPHRVATARQIEKLSSEITTNLGIEIHTLEGGSMKLSGETSYHYEPGMPFDHSMTYSLSLGERAILTLTGHGDVRRFEIHSFDPDKLVSGRRFVVDRLIDDDTVAAISGETRHGALHDLTDHDGAIRFRTEGESGGSFVIRPIVLNKAQRGLLYRLRDKNNIGGMVNGEEDASVSEHQGDPSGGR